MTKTKIFVILFHTTSHAPPPFTTAGFFTSNFCLRYASPYASMCLPFVSFILQYRTVFYHKQEAQPEFHLHLLQRPIPVSFTLFTSSWCDGSNKFYTSSAQASTVCSPT